MLKVTITGSSGLVGSRIVELLGERCSFIPLSHKELDITDKKNVTLTLGKLDFDIFLHLAAYTNVDGAEKDKKTAFDINVTGTRNVYESTRDLGKKFIYISTGFVFDGRNPPYTEDSKPNPISYYGQTKYEGETMLANKAMIVRIDYPYRAYYESKRDFVRTIKYLLEQKKPLQMVTDSLFTPTYIDDIAYSLDYLMNHFSPEIFHIVGGNSLSPYEAGLCIAKSFGLNKSLITPTSYKNYFAGKAKRPQYAELKSKRNAFYRMKTFQEGLYDIKKNLS